MFWSHWLRDGPVEFLSNNENGETWRNQKLLGKPRKYYEFSNWFIVNLNVDVGYFTFVKKDQNVGVIYEMIPKLQ